MNGDAKKWLMQIKKIMANTCENCGAVWMRINIMESHVTSLTVRWISPTMLTQTVSAPAVLWETDVRPSKAMTYTTTVSTKSSTRTVMQYRCKPHKAKAKQRCVMGVGMCLYAQLVQTKNKQCKSEIILQWYHPHLSDLCSRPRLNQPYNHII